MTKPRIFIHMHYMALGGAERALLGLLNALDPNRVDVDLFLNQHTGEFMPLIPKHVNLLPERRGYNAIERPLINILREGQWRIFYARLINKLKRCIARKKMGLSGDGTSSHFVMDAVDHMLSSLHELGEYDLAISFLDPPHVVQDKVLAKKRMEWIHTDFTSFYYDVNATFPRWAANDYIASISPDITRSFIQLFPTLKNKIIEIENILSAKFIRQQAEMCINTELFLDPLSFKILSIGRFTHQKNFDSIPDMAARLFKLGCTDFKWYIIGFGPDESIIRQKISEASMNDNVIILGKTDNPYPYIKACDIYVQPSRFEGKCVAVREAQILCKPVVITRYPTSSSQLTDGVDGVICEMDNESVAKAIFDLANDKERQQRLIAYLKTHDYGNESEINKIYKLLNV